MSSQLVPLGIGESRFRDPGSGGCIGPASCFACFASCAPKNRLLFCCGRSTAQGYRHLSPCIQAWTVTSIVWSPKVTSRQAIKPETTRALVAMQDVMKEWDIDGDGTVALHELTEVPVPEFARSALDYGAF